jgi:urease accessory protein
MAGLNDNAIGPNPRAVEETAMQPPVAKVPAATPISLTRRGLPPPAAPVEASWALALSADERTRLRGLRQSRCGQPLLLQLPRGEPLEPGEWLGRDGGPALVRVEAADEFLLLVQADDPLDLLRAAYHLGNRHVALEVSASELRLLDDPVLADLLRQRGLRLEQRRGPFLPEGGAYAAAHAHAHCDSHSHGPDGGHPPGAA